jgi:hypothetical protein
VELVRSGLDVTTTILTRAALRQEDATTVNVLEIAVGELELRLDVVSSAAIDPEVPNSVELEIMVDEVLVLLLDRRAVLAPVVALVGDIASLQDEPLGVLERHFVQYEVHTGNLGTRRAANNRGARWRH